MLTNEHIEESLSISYVNAIVAHAGQVFEIRDRDYGVDGSVVKIDKIANQYIDLGAAFDCQLKATVTWQFNEEKDLILYDMKVDAYNRLIRRNKNGTIPCVLILLCLPQSKNDWLTINEHELILRKCCYYYYLNGDETDNESSKRVKIPIVNIFDCASVNEIVKDPFGVFSDA